MFSRAERENVCRSRLPFRFYSNTPVGVAAASQKEHDSKLFDYSIWVESTISWKRTLLLWTNVSAPSPGYSHRFHLCKHIFTMPLHNFVLHRHRINTLFAPFTPLSLSSGIGELSLPEKGIRYLTAASLFNAQLAQEIVERPEKYYLHCTCLWFPLCEENLIYYILLYGPSVLFYHNHSYKLTI